MRSFAIVAAALAGLSNVSVTKSRRQLHPAEPAASVVANTAMMASLNQGTVSTDTASLESNTTEYYLGYRIEDFQKPYAKYWDPVIAPLSNALNGYFIGDNGTLMIAVRSEIPQVTVERYDWWFGWHSVETARYKLWNPVAHQYSYCAPYSENWANETYAESYIGATSYIVEYVGQDAAKLSIECVESESLGFNTTAWPELGIETIALARS
ncbi:phloretin hydrolase [Penicillium pulvis]|uniref:phloretin hydrolase n=1 Tax=Penicillium pulvis TaxID=1562058 RepID=UPI002548AFD6|nr:phloretin hydrolase [Penicillium pulvis]KAJ5806547.1 phloretin hydrolase [Penicillium pulvis]